MLGRETAIGTGDGDGILNEAEKRTDALPFFLPQIRDNGADAK